MARVLALLGCGAVLALAAPEGMLDTDAVVKPVVSLARDGDDVSLYQHEMLVKKREFRQDGSDDVATKSGVGPSSMSSECTVPISPLGEECLSWNPSQAKVPPSPCLGPLEQLIGTWEGFGNVVTWQPMVPVPAIKLQGATRLTPTGLYREILTFEPIMSTVLNKGYSANGHCMVQQVLQGLQYKQEIRSYFDNQLMGLLHQETGALMYNVEPGGDSNWTVSRMAATPRGITFNAFGKHTSFHGGDAKTQLLEELAALDLDILPTEKCMRVPYNLEHLEDYSAYGSILKQSLFKNVEEASAVKSFTKIDLPESTVLVNPFLQKAAETTDFKSTFFIENLESDSGEVEQILVYGQSAKVLIGQRLDCITCPGLSRGADGCYANKTQSLSECFVDSSLDPSCSDRPYNAFPHLQVATLKKVA